MEYRKLISFGKNSFVVSLPKAWVRSNKLKKGDLIYIQEGPANLVLRPNAAETIEEQEIVINVDGKTKSQIQREIIPAYINNFTSIVLSGSEIKNKAQEIEPVIQNLIALEILEQNSSKIQAKVFLNMKEISVADLIRKMDVIIRSMLTDCANMFVEDTYENINHRDKDVNRLSYLIFRSVNFGFINQAFYLKKFNLSAAQLLKTHLLTYHLEAIADDVRRVARYMQKAKFDKKTQDRFNLLLARVRENYLGTLKGYYANDWDMAHKIAATKRPLIEDIEQFFMDNRDKEWSGYLITHFKRLSTNIHKMGRMTYQ
jgi:phosphate uptake regulator